MTREEALTLLRAHFDVVEPSTPCPTCMGKMFPRVRDWQPGLVWSPEYMVWWEAFQKWEETRVGTRPPRPKTPMYIPCNECGATGQIDNGKGPLHEALEALR